MAGLELKFPNQTENQTKDNEWLRLILHEDIQERYFDSATETTLVTCFSLLITFGAVGNGLVMFVVMRNPSMRTPRNIFIINLAISDFTLCLFTQPLNMYLLLYKQWGLGEFMCKFVTMAQGTNLFVSTISITAIALDRFQVIVYPTKDSMKKIGAAIALISIWLISFLIASPALLFSVVHRRQALAEVPNVYVYVCLEDVTLEIEKRAYSVAQMVVQYVLPFFILSVAHLRICNKLRYRMVTQNLTTSATTSFQKKKNERRSRRKRKTNLLLAGIALVFALSWLPLNIFNLMTDFRGEFFTGRVDMKLAYAICHMLVLCSGCLNPVLYGWLNDNFRTEFMKVLCCPCCKIAEARCKRVVCCSKQATSVPAITLTKVSNGQSLALDEGMNGKPDSFTLQFHTRVP
ncbi:neuropeptide F receptor-like [Physella acuta]|uniref:neuropeptide F receptor-like n=1 Tax=Physella acuta TaxID=109671 RepID=UPI0027DB4B1B|nr:neuropeptide F receptor-like [Physella acuta]XP_059168728.1 neuropeptide F receptor-like [Physella acuta]